MTNDQANPTGWRPRARLVFFGFAAIALIVIGYEHQAHLWGVLPFLFLLSCPLMHLFMHHGHGHHHHDDHVPAPPVNDTKLKGGPDA